jgi:hypothetical protein
VKRPSAADTQFAELLNDSTYDDRQVGRVVRLMLAAAEENQVAGYKKGLWAGFEVGFETGGEEAYEVGFETGGEEAYEVGFEDGEDDAYIKDVYVGVYLDETGPVDLGSTLRLVAVAVSREKALELANAYRDTKGQGAVFSFKFHLQ